MAKIEKLQSLLTKLKAKEKQAKDADASVTVGYTAAYAVFVHEDLEANHTNGSAKFLEQPARQLSKQLATIVRTSAQQGKPLRQGLLLAGLFLQRESQKLVPVDTGNLRASAYTRIE